jgi:hypothetical protein
MTYPGPLRADERSLVAVELGLDADEEVWQVLTTLDWDRRLVPKTPREACEVGLMPTSRRLVLLDPRRQRPVGLALPTVSVSAVTHKGIGFILLRHEHGAATYSTHPEGGFQIVELLATLGAVVIGSGEVKAKRVARRGTRGWAARPDGSLTRT